MDQPDAGGKPPPDSSSCSQEAIEARWREVERLRRVHFGIEACEARMQHVIRIIPLSAK